MSVLSLLRRERGGGEGGGTDGGDGMRSTAPRIQSFLYGGGYLMGGMETWESEYESMTRKQSWYPNGGRDLGRTVSSDERLPEALW